MNKSDGQLDEILELLHNSWLEDDYDPKDPDAIEAKKAIKQLLQSQTLDVINYIMSKPTGELTMTAEQMKATPDDKWRDEVIQYFFNTESLMANLDRMKSSLNN